MKELVIISGKGGTGKTSFTAGFASFSQKAVLCDADVDAADLHLLMKPEVKKEHDFKGGGVAVINNDKCSQCGLCMELCKFDAIKPTFEVDDIQCEGCGVCVDFCPEKAIDFPIKTCGNWFLSDTRFGAMVHARLGIAEENSGKLVSTVRQAARKYAEENSLDMIITDGPPGIGCPVIASMSQASALCIVTEPTLSGLHDMERVAKLAAGFKIPAMICINKFDLNPEQSEKIEAYAKKENIEFLGKIPYDPIFTKAMIQEKTVTEYDKDSAVSKKLKEIWDKILLFLNPPVFIQDKIS